MNNLRTGKTLFIRVLTILITGLNEARDHSLMAILLRRTDETFIRLASRERADQRSTLLLARTQKP